ncbi:MAG: hypothetical protein FWG75_10140 [Cystobacterineae bacterium]|nr:hypothetical protein [Cystobacterineae bacterium]
MKAFLFFSWTWALLCFVLPSASFAEPNALLKMKIFFGHNSVGDDMLNGLKTAQPQLRIVRSNEASALGQPGFAHFSTDNNGQPLKKIEVFERWLNAGMGKTTNLAFNKFCYMDFNAQSHVPALFKAYKESISRLEMAFPSLQLLHITIPLKGTWDIHGNQKREQFNKLLRQTYGDKVFDLAKIQSTRLNGSVERTQKGDPALVKAYSDDDGHLNHLGKERVTEAFLPFLLQHGASTQ